MNWNLFIYRLVYILDAKLQALYDDNGSIVARVFIARSRLAERWRRIENTATSEHTNTISGRIRY